MTQEDAQYFPRTDIRRIKPGVFEVRLGLPIGQAIEDILLLATYSFEDEWEGRVAYLPLP